MLIGYIRVSKSDGKHTLEPQRDAVLAVGIDPSRIYDITRDGYDTKSVADQFDARPAEIRQLLRGALDAARAR